MCDFGKIVKTAVGVGSLFIPGGGFLSTALTVASLGATAIGTLKGIDASKNATKAQNRAIKLQQAADEIKQARERRQVIREQRIKIATATQAAANQGASDSSAVAGGTGSITSQGNSSLSFLDSVGDLNAATTTQNQRANQFSADANTYASIANFGSTIFNANGGFGSLFGDLNKPVDRKTP